MHTQLAAITEIPLIVLLFLLQYWQPILAGVWGVGFAYIAFRAMVRWYKEDAADASYNVPQGDEGAIYDAMREIKVPKRPARMKWLFTRGLFWMPILAWRTVVKVAKFAFYPILVVIDKEKSKAVSRAARAPRTLHREVGVPPIATLEPAVKLKAEVECNFCHNVIPMEASHNCRSVRLSCTRCGATLVGDTVHQCSLVRRNTTVVDLDESEPDDLPECDHCGAEMEPNQVHSCEERSELLFCRTCQEKYDPQDAVHQLEDCSDCETSHCSWAGCR